MALLFVWCLVYERRGSPFGDARGTVSLSRVDAETGVVRPGFRGKQFPRGVGRRGSVRRNDLRRHQRGSHRFVVVLSYQFDLLLLVHVASETPTSRPESRLLSLKLLGGNEVVPAYLRRSHLVNTRSLLFAIVLSLLQIHLRQFGKGGSVWVSRVYLQVDLLLMIPAIIGFLMLLAGEISLLAYHRL